MTRRRTLSIALAAAVAIASPIAFAIVHGDVNNDGRVDAADVLLTQRHTQGLVDGSFQLDPSQATRADVAPMGTVAPIGDSTVDVRDLAVLLRAVAGENVDGDDLPPWFEAILGTDPFLADTDGNGIVDAQEDFDQDGLSNYGEYVNGRNPFNAYSAGNGILDGIDVLPDPSRGVATNRGASVTDLYDDPYPSQQGAVSAELGDARRLAVVRGRVRDRVNNAIAGVQVEIEGHPELGRTLTRIDGSFDLVVNGGGLLTLNFDKRPAFLRAQRQVDVPWQDFVSLADLILVAPDVATPVTLGSTAMQRVQGSAMADASGTRRATLLFQPGTTAQFVLDAGNQPASGTVHVRATEYTWGPTGPAAMPAELPPSSAYTYAVELSVDEAPLASRSVQFDRRVIFYLENFIGMPVGSGVPYGTYDAKKAAWVPEDENARVVKVIGIQNGRAQLDTDTSPGADCTETGCALTEWSVQELEQVASLYPIGAELWRVAVGHFSDINLAPAEPTGLGKPPVPTGTLPPPDDPCRRRGSILGCETMSLGESVPIAGTPFSLHYESERTPGYKDAYTIEIPLRSGAALPAEVTRVEIEIQVAGRREVAAKTPAEVNGPAGGTYAFTWDGKDAYGRALQGRAPVRVRLGYVSAGPGYQASGRFGAVGNGSAVSNVASRSERIVWQAWEGLVGTFDARGVGLGGWTITPHHVYDPFSKVLYRGDGTRRNAEQLPEVVRTVAGGGSQVPAEGGVATQANLLASVSYPNALAAGPDGGSYIGLSFPSAGGVVWRVGKDGLLRKFAGGNTAPPPPGDDLAVHAKFATVRGIAFGPDGSVYLADWNEGRVRRVTPDGKIAVLAGSGLPTPLGDGGPATSASVPNPIGLAVAADGTVYIASSSRIRRVDPSGVISTAAGTGSCCAISVTDSGRATGAQIGVVEGVSLAPDGTLYIGTSTGAGGGRLLAVSPSGAIRTAAGWAGAGNPGFVSDGSAATSGTLASVTGVAAARDGSVFIAERGRDRIRKVGADGIIATVAGNGQQSYNGDGLAALATAVYAPSSVAVGPDGSVSMTVLPALVRRLEPALPAYTAGSILVPSEDGAELYEFDAAGRHVKTVETVRGSTTDTFAYDAANRLVSITDADGNVTLVERAGDGTPLAIRGPFGQRTTLQLDTQGFLSRVTDPANRAHQFASTAGGLLQQYTPPNAGSPFVYVYDAATGRLQSDADPAGGSQALARAPTASGYEVSVTTGLGRVTRYRTERLPDGRRQRQVTDPAGLVTTEVRASDTQAKADDVRTTSRPDGFQTVEVPDAESGAFGFAATYPKSVLATTAGGQTVERLVESRTVSRGSAGELTGLSETIRIKRGTFSHPAATRSFTLNADLVALPDAPHRWHYMSPLGRIVDENVDSRGRLRQRKVGSLEPLRLEYDARGRLAFVKQGAGAAERVTSLVYSATTGFLDQLVDPLGRALDVTQRDAGGRVTEVVLPGNRTVGFAFDPNGNLTSLTPPGRPAHGFAYTAVNQEQLYTPPEIVVGEPRAVSRTYNVDRQLERVTRPDAGSTIDPAYEATTGRLDTLAIPQGVLDYAYHPTTGHVASIQAPGGVGLGFTHDGPLLLSATWTGPVAGSVANTYEELRPKTETVTGDGASPVTFSYDDDGLLESVSRPGSPTLTLAHDASHGLPTGSTVGAVTTTLAYDGFGERTSETTNYNATSLYAVTYPARDKLGRIVTKTESVQGAAATSTTYTYDPAGRLDTVTVGSSLVADYAYDANGNRTKEREDLGGGPIATYDAQDRLLSYSGATFTYTLSGELATRTESGQTTTYTYDPLGAVRQVTLPGGTAIDYGVDGLGRRIGKKRNGALEKGWLYADALRIVAEMNGAGAVTSRFVYGEGINVPELMVRGGVTYKLVTDHLGSVRLVVNVASGAVAQRTDYDAWGKVVSETLASGFDPVPFGFAGGLYDRDTQLVRFGARDYDPRVGGWTSKDPIRFSAGDPNLFAYAVGDPSNVTDPTGLTVNCVQLADRTFLCFSGPGSRTPIDPGLYETPYGRPEPESADWGICLGPFCWIDDREFQRMLQRGKGITEEQASICPAPPYPFAGGGAGLPSRGELGSPPD